MYHFSFSDSSIVFPVSKTSPFSPLFIYEAVPVASDTRHGTPCIIASAATVGIGSSLFFNQDDAEISASLSGTSQPAINLPAYTSYGNATI